MLAIALIVLGIFSRVFFHVGNFTPVLAIAIFAGVYLPRRISVLVPLALFIISDLIIGFHQTLPFTWGSIVLIALIGWKVRSHKTVGTVALGSLAAAVLFYIVTNFGVWAVTGMYPKTLAGLGECFTAGIPFFRFTLVSTFIYVVVLFGLYEWVALKVRNTKLAKAL